MRLTDGQREIFLGSSKGKAVRFPEERVRSMGRTAAGVRGMALGQGDVIVGAEVVAEGCTVLSVTERGYGKRTSLEDYRLTNRGGKGIVNLKVVAKNGPVVGIMQVYEDDEFILITSGGQVIRSKVKDIAVHGRGTQGVRVINLASGDRVVGVARLPEQEETDELAPQDGDQAAGPGEGNNEKEAKG